MKYYHKYKLESKLKKCLNNLKGILFDLDGVLIDSTEGWILAITYILAKEKIDLPQRSILLEIIAKTTLEQIKEINPHISPDKAKEIANKVDNHFITNIQKNVQVFDGSHLLLNTLIELGLKLAIVTNNNREITKMILETFDLQKYFDVIITISECPSPKPDPAPILQAIAKLGLEKENVIYVGDSLSDLQASRDADVVCVLIDRENLQLEMIKTVGEFYAIEDLFTLKDLFLEIKMEKCI